MPELDLTTHSLAYEVRGDGDPVLLIGGSGEPMEGWEFCGLVDALVEAGHGVVWCAARGVKPSGCPPLPWTVTSMADDALALLDALDIDACIGIGYSLGGFTLEELTRLHPERISRAVLIASAGASGAGRGTLSAAWHEADHDLVQRLGEIPASYTRLVTLLTSLGGPELVDAGLVADWWELLGGQDELWAAPHGEVGQAQACKTWTDRGGSTAQPWPDVPAAIISFEFDALFPPGEAAQVAGHLGDAHVEIVAGTGHAGLFTRPTETIAAVLRALTV